MNTTLKDAVRVLVGSTIGKAGLTLLAFLVAVSAYVLATYPLDFGTKEWSNPAVWADNPKAVPPVWLNLPARVRQRRPRDALRRRSR